VQTTPSFSSIQLNYSNMLSVTINANASPSVVICRGQLVAAAAIMRGGARHTPNVPADIEQEELQLSAAKHSHAQC
jgi:hypothetical protein